MNTGTHERLLQSLKSGTEVAVMADSFGIDGSLGDARDWVITQAQADGFGDVLAESMPDALKPPVRQLWEAWRRRNWPGKRIAIKRLRHVIRAATRMAATFRQCLEEVNRA